jgi:hypothetical protein
MLPDIGFSKWKRINTIHLKKDLFEQLTVESPIIITNTNHKYHYNYSY